ncbi:MULTISPECIES: CoA transferase [Amycolatopsis]|uniref:CoA transferase n=2 Tax=Amycolatopsis TaxID=1813 RepID=A0ABW5I758_9PSEU
MEHESQFGPLRGLRVLETATGVAGPYAGRLLAMLGATVAKVEPEGGDPARRLSADGEPQRDPSPVFVHLNAGKRLLSPDAAAVPELLEWADVVLSDRVRGEFGPWELRAGVAEPPLLVSVTAWGLDADSAGEPSDEMLVQAASGLLAATCHEDGGPDRFPGWQTQYLAGTYAAAAALAGRPGGHAETTWLAAAASAVESQAAAALYAATSANAADPEEERRQAGFQTRTFPSGVFRCADGFVVPGTVRGEDWNRQCLLYDRGDLLRDERFVWARRWANRELLRGELAGWYAGRTRGEVFDAGLAAGWSVGKVLDAADALDDPHLAAREFLGEVRGASAGRAIVRPWRDPATPAPRSARLSEPAGDNGWFRSGADRDRPPLLPRLPDPHRLRVLELTWAWAGPLAGRLLGALGADVVRVESGRHPDGWRTRFRFAETGAPLPEGAASDEYTWDAAAQFNSVNRNKRAVSLDLSAPDGNRVFRELVDAADVLVVNMNHRVLEDRGVAAHVRARVAEGLVLVTMPALGSSGPHRAMPGFGMLTEAMGGFAARYGPPSAGAEVSPTYYPDAVAGAHAAVAVLSGLAARATTGRGREIDLSQQETLWLQLGEGIVLASREGRSPRRIGNSEPDVPAGVLATSDGYVAFVGGAADERWAAEHDSETVVEALRQKGFRAERMRSVRELFENGELRWAERVRHPVTGERGYLGIPVGMDGKGLATVRPAPCYDQHTDEVLTEWLEMPPEELAALRAAEAIGTVPRQPYRVRKARRAS